jgi:hypothetical protein
MRKDKLKMVWLCFIYSPFHVPKKDSDCLQIYFGFSTEISLKGKLCQYKTTVCTEFMQVTIVSINVPLILPRR